jgi:two-component system response regulator NreC
MIYDRPINIMLVDDHELLLKGLRGLLETRPAFRVVAEASGVEEALRTAKDRGGIDLVVTDLGMPHGTTAGIELTMKLLAEFPTLHVLIYTMHNEDKHILQAIQAGASGYVLKDRPASDIINAISSIVKGKTVFPPVLELERLLTPTERQVLWLLGDGKSNTYIAVEIGIAKGKLGITRRTVEGHRSSIWQKLRTVLPEEEGENPAVLINIATRYRDRSPFPIIIDAKVKDRSSR